MLTKNPIPTTLRAETKALPPPSETHQDASTSPFTFTRRVVRDVSYARPTTTTTTGGAAADADARLQDLDVYFWGRNGVGDCVDDDDDDDNNNNNNYGTVGTMAGVALVGAEAEAEAEAEAKAEAKAEREGLWVMYVNF